MIKLKWILSIVFFVGFLLSGGLVYSNSFDKRLEKNLKEKCDNGSAESCSALGEKYSTGTGVFPDARKALEYFTLACENGYERACNKYESTKKKWENDKKLAPFYTKTCNSGDAESCYHLGNMYNKGEALSRNEYLAFANFQNACEGGFNKGCEVLAFFYFVGRGVDENREEAIRLYNSTCASGGGGSCFYLGFLHEKGMDAGKSLNQKIMDTHKVCNLKKDDGCKFLTTMYIEGIGVEKNYSNSVSYYEKGCALNHVNSCTSLKRLKKLSESGFNSKITFANMNETNKKIEALKYIRRYEAECKNGDYIKCTNLGTKYIIGKVVEHNVKKADHYFNMACGQGEAIACYRLVKPQYNHNLDENELTRIITLYSKSCDGDVYRACDQIGEMYEHGQRINKDYLKAEEAYKKSCFSGVNVPGCINLSGLYKKSESQRNVDAVDYATISMARIKSDCKQKKYSACLYLGEAYKKGDRVSKDYTSSLKAYKLACEGKLYHGCSGMVFLYMNGHVWEEQKMIRHKERLCKSGLVHDCAFIANVYERGIGVKKDIKKATLYLKESCLFGDKNACGNYERLSN